MQSVTRQRTRCVVCMRAGGQAGVLASEERVMWGQAGRQAGGGRAGGHVDMDALALTVL